jgi:Helix-turn-helix domain
MQKHLNAVHSDQQKLTAAKRTALQGKRKPLAEAKVAPEAKILVCREEVAEIVSLRIRSIDYLLASKQLPSLKIGTRTMIPVSELQRFARAKSPGQDCFLN